MTHICVSKLTIIGSDNGSSPDRRQAIIWTNAGILLIGPLGTNFSEIVMEILRNFFIQENAFESVVCETASILYRPQCVKTLRASSSKFWLSVTDISTHHVYILVFQIHRRWRVVSVMHPPVQHKRRHRKWRQFHWEYPRFPSLILKMSFATDYFAKIFLSIKKQEQNKKSQHSQIS